MKNLKPLDYQYVFIIGLARSGTTLVQSLIATHRNVHTFPETHIFRILSKLKIDGDSVFTADKLETFKTRLENKIPGVSKKIDFDRIAKQSNLNIKDLVSLILIELAKVWSDNVVQTGDIILEKTPRHFLDILQIQILYPNSKFIHVVRDPIENIASLQTSFNMPMSILAGIRCWRRSNKLVREISRKNNNVYVVIYNKLIVDMHKEMELVGGFLDINFNDADLEKFEKQYEKVSLIYEKWKTNRKSKHITDNSQKWKKILKLNEAWLIETFLKKEYVFYDLKWHNIRIDLFSKCSVIIQELFKYLFYKLKTNVRN